ncbi:MAG: EcoKI restriction-modification system protein HsdS [Syntrophorhabdus sp. PtaU1.Bin002]|nr:MAG: EcoKI restriction-modification system protein HsdS [Syntrophorhabdus sp. PtaU1.Bin002]
MNNNDRLSSLPETWCEYHLGDLCKSIGGGTPSRNRSSFWNGDVPWASVKDFTDNQVFLKTTCETITNEGLQSSASNLVPENTPVICTRMAVGRCALTTRPTAINQDLKALLFSTEVNRQFFIRLLNYNASELERVSIGSTVRGITLHDLRNLILHLPSDNMEQQRVAWVLDVVDESIAETEAIVAKLRNIRAGLLHDLLTYGLDEYGQLRDPIVHPEQFKDSPLGRIPVGWSFSKFDVVLTDIEAGKSPDYPDYPAPSGEWGVLKVSAIWPDGFRAIENKWVRRRVHQNGAFEVKNGDLLISRSNTYSLVGLVCIVSDAPPHLMLSDKTLRLCLNPERGLNPFFALLLQSRAVRSQIELNATGTSGSMKNISQELIRNLGLAYPEVEEQRRILSLTSTIENEQAALFSQLTKLQHLKSGLMSDLLTGRVRVPESIEVRSP